MKLPPSGGRELEKLFQDLEDGAISAEDHEVLMDLLRHSAAARQDYIKHMALAASLCDIAAACMPDQEKPAETHESHQRRSLRRSFLAAAAVVAMMAVAGSFIAIRHQLRPRVSVEQGVVTDWRFSSGGIDADGDFQPGTQVVVSHGTLQLTTRNQTRILLEGPAVFEIHNPLQTTLTSGKGWFDVSEKDRRFTVLTDRLRVIDLGTRFGVAAAAGSDRVQVESGEVRLASRHPGIAPMTLKSGQAAIANPVGRSAPAEYDPALFLNRLPTQVMAIHWSFDEEEDEGFPATAYGLDAHPIRVSSFGGEAAISRVVPGKFGTALDLTDARLFAESDYPGITGSSPRTVAFWIKTRPIPRRETSHGTAYTPPVILWGDSDEPGGIWSVRAHCASGIIGTQWGNRGWVTAGRTGSMILHDLQWHHIASVFTGRTLADGSSEIRHYIDGRRVETTQAVPDERVDTRIETSPSGKLRLAYDPSFSSGPRNVPVVLDELHIIRAAIDDAGIESLFRENRLPPSR